MPANDVKLYFKKGTQANFNQLSSYQEGTFYLTEDTNRLYVGQRQNNTVVPALLNQTIQMVDKLRREDGDPQGLTYLPPFQSDESIHADDVYYVKQDNILAIWRLDPERTGQNLYGWCQINSQPAPIKLDDVDISATYDSTAQDVGITVAVSDTSITAAGDSPFSDTVRIKGDNGVSVGVDNNGKVAIHGTSYSLSKSNTLSGTDITKTTINLNKKETADGAETVASSIVLEAGNNVNFTAGTGNSLVINANDTILDTSSTGLSYGAQAGQIDLSISDTAGTTITDSLSNAGIKLHDGSAALLVDTTNANMPNSNIYSKAEIDTLLSGLDGMTYRGSLGSGSSIPTTGVQNGDVYVISDTSITLPATANRANPNDYPGGTNNSFGALRVGDLLIASNAEGANASILWTYIPSGNDDLDVVSYSADINASTNDILLKNGLETPLVEFSVTSPANNDVVTTSIASVINDNNPSDSTPRNKLNINVAHKTINATSSSTSQTTANINTFTAVTGLTVNNNGHVTNIETGTFSIAGYTLTGTSANITGGVKVTNTITSDVGSSSSNAIAFTTETLSISQSTATVDSVPTSTVTMDIIWGTF